MKRRAQPAVQKDVIGTSVLANAGALAPVQGKTLKIPDERLRRRRVAKAALPEMSRDELIAAHDAAHAVWDEAMGEPTLGAYGVIRRHVDSPESYEVVFRGLPVTIEIEAGEMRRGVGPDGAAWSRAMHCAYGCVPGSKGADGDELDVYLGPDALSNLAFVVHQAKRGPDGFDGWDEDKVMLGFPTSASAREMYLAHYPDPRFLGAMSVMTVDDVQAHALAGAPWPDRRDLVSAQFPVNVLTSQSDLDSFFRAGAPGRGE